MTRTTDFLAFTRRAATAAGLAFALLAVPSAATATLRYDLQIYGLLCGLCADGLEKNLGALAPDAANVEVDLEEGIASFETTQDSIVDPEAIRRAVRDVGFDPRSLTLTASGTISRSAHELRLRIDANRSIRLGPGPGLDSLRQLVGDHAGELTISGSWSGSGESVHLHVVEVDPS